jgi:hypothetical protein
VALCPRPHVDSVLPLLFKSVLALLQVQTPIVIRAPKIRALQGFSPCLHWLDHETRAKMTVETVESMAHTKGKAPEEPPLVRGGKDWVSCGPKNAILLPRRLQHLARRL